MKLSELQRKDIININDGTIVGRVIDAIIDDKGYLEGIIIEKSKYMRSLFNNNTDINIKYEQIKKIGNDVILIEL